MFENYLNSIEKMNKYILIVDNSNQTQNFSGMILNCIKDHIGILVDGTVIPCCLDGDGIINLGNIYETNLEDIINSKRYQDMYNGFKRIEKVEELCKRCNFISKK